MDAENDNTCLSWEEYFMATAFLAARRSKDPNTKVGACIVDHLNRVVSIGYNGFPRGCKVDSFPWSKDESASPLEQKYMYVVHAETNAILNRNSIDVTGLRMYVALFPCNECAKLIIQCGIKEVIFLSDKHAEKLHTIAAKRMFDEVGVKYRQFIPQHKKITIDFTKINWDQQNQLPSTPLKRTMKPSSSSTIDGSLIVDSKSYNDSESNTVKGLTMNFHENCTVDRFCIADSKSSTNMQN